MSKKRRSPDTVTIRAVALRYSTGFVLDAHAHAWSQLLYASEGVMVVETSVGSWVVPPHRAVWLPAHVDHQIEMRGSVAMRTLYFREPVEPRGSDTRVINVSPLLRELIIHCATLGKLDLAVAREERLAGLILDLLGEVATVPMMLPLPRDARALRVVQHVKRDPALRTPALAKLAGASRRTLERSFVAETGMTFGKWRQQARLQYAMTRLAEGASVEQTAIDTGYESASAFIAMFRTALGTTPRRFLLAG